MDANSKDFGALVQTAIKLEMTGSLYTWIFMGDATSSQSAAKMTYLEIPQFGDMFDRSMVLINDCRGPDCHLRN